MAHIIRRQNGTDHSTTPGTIVTFALIAVGAAVGFTGLAGGMGSPAASIGVFAAVVIIMLGFAVGFAAIRREEAGTDRSVVTVFGTPMTRPDVAFLSEIEGRAPVPLLFRSHPKPGRRYVDTIAAAEDLAEPADNPSS